MKETKFRVEFKCYHYNTGSADNYSYMSHEDFDELEDAQRFRTQLIEQRTNEMNYQHGKMSFNKFSKWEKSFSSRYYSVEDGYVSFSIYGELPTISKIESTKDVVTILM